MNSKQQNIYILSMLFFGILILTACPKPQKYSEIPQIKFKQVILFDTIDDFVLQNPAKGYKLKFGLIDGDGNIGLKENDSIGLDIDTNYINNFLSILYEVKNGDTIIVDSINGYNMKIPYVEPQGQNKTLLADIFVDWTFTYINEKLPYDSVMFEFFIIDRELNKSNLEKTPVLKLDTIGEFPVIEENE